MNDQIITLLREAFRAELLIIKEEIIKEVKELLEAQKEPEEPNEILTLKEAAFRLKISQSTLNRKKAFYGAFNVGRSIRFNSKVIDERHNKNHLT